MNQPMPPKKPMSAPARQAEPISREMLQTEGSQRRAVVRYYRRMRKQRVYPLLVGFQAKRGGADATGSSILVRPVVPGAHVTPSELPLDAASPSAQVTFYVTPLAKGSLPDARVQLYQQGHLVQEIGLPMKSVSQRKTWAWAALTVIIPLLLLYYGKYYPLTGTFDRVDGTAVIHGAKGDPGEVLEARIKENIPPVPRFDVTAYAAYGLGWVYTGIYGFRDVYFSFVVFVVLVLLTFLSWIGHTARRARRRGEPIVLRG